MNVGKTLFALVMEFVSWKTFGRIVERHKGDAGMRMLSCADVFSRHGLLSTYMAQSLRDIGVCLEANQAKLYHMSIAAPPAGSTLTDALDLRDWRIYHSLAVHLMWASMVEQACRRLKLQPTGTRPRTVGRLDKSEAERLIRSTYKSDNKYGLMIKTPLLSGARGRRVRPHSS